MFFGNVGKLINFVVFVVIICFVIDILFILNNWNCIGLECFFIISWSGCCVGSGLGKVWMLKEGFRVFVFEILL